MLSCPFCHTNDDLLLGVFRKTASVECRNCGCIGPRIDIENDFGGYLSQEEAERLARDKWNFR